MQLTRLFGHEMGDEIDIERYLPLTHVYVTLTYKLTSKHHPPVFVRGRPKVSSLTLILQMFFALQCACAKSKARSLRQS